MASCAAHEGIKQRGRSARVCEAGVEAWMMGPGEQEDLEVTNEPIEWLVRGGARARARTGRTKATKASAGREQPWWFCILGGR